MVVETFKWIAGIRVTDKKEYAKLCDLEKDLMIGKIDGSLVGYKIYNCNMKEFDSMSQLQKSQAVTVQKFDKEAFRGEKQ